MKKITVFAAVLVFSACSGRTPYINVEDLPDTYQCQYMKEICKEASEFEDSFSKMSEEEQEEAKTVLNAYINQCDTALKACQQSAR